MLTGPMLPTPEHMDAYPDTDSPGPDHIISIIDDGGCMTDYVEHPDHENALPLEGAEEYVRISIDLVGIHNVHIVTRIGRSNQAAQKRRLLRLGVLEENIHQIPTGGHRNIRDNDPIWYANDKVEALAKIPGLGGVITGKAVYEGRFTVSEGLAALAAAQAGQS